MCYFHVLHNVRKNKTLLPKSEYDNFIFDIKGLHYSRTAEIYNVKVKKFNEKWKNHKDMLSYFKKSWLLGDFTKWQIFHNPPGYASTNSNIESFNASIKRDFTLRRRLSVAVIMKFGEITTYYSLHSKTFFTTPAYNRKLQDKAFEINKDRYKKQGKYLVSIKSGDISYYINLKDGECTCCSFVKNAICKHSLSYSNRNSCNWFGPEYTKQASKFITKIKRGRPKHAESALKR